MRTDRIGRPGKLITVVALSGSFVWSTLSGVAPANAADPCVAPVANQVACENTLTGTPESTWQVQSPSPNIVGFTTATSANVGTLLGFKVKTPSTSYRIDIYRLGWYAGNGARLVTSLAPSVPLPQAQPACLDQNTTTGLIDCGNWAVSALWNIPATAVSGEYLADLERLDGAATGQGNQIPFIVRDDSSHSGLLFQASDTTWQAYNSYGGNSLYGGTAPAGRAYKVSFNRPYENVGADNAYSNAEYPTIRFLEHNGYDVSYISGVDTARDASILLRHRTFLSVGHDEYWSGEQRSNVEQAKAAGTNLVFWSGNDAFWKTRFEPSIDASATAWRTLVCYKETKDNQKIDPSPVWTGTWRDPRFSPPADGGRPENALSGQLFMVNGRRTDALQVPAAYGRTRLWRNTSVAALAAGSTATLSAGTLGYEWDADVDNGFQPSGLARYSETTVNLQPDPAQPGAGFLLQDFGNTFGFGPATHRMTMYRDPTSGALVFGAGTVQWAWGLDANHEFAGSPADVRIQQATVNLLADMGAQPATLQTGLVAATASSDSVAPVSTIDPQSSLQVGVPATLTGTATDAGGVVAGVDVSVDGGAAWHHAAGLGLWSYSYLPVASGPLTVKVRAVDDSANLESPHGSTFNVKPQVCPCTIFGNTLPGTSSSSDASALELGVKFRADADGTVTGIRFYKGIGNTGTHTGSLWTATGALLASGTFTGETATGWQQLTFASPVAMTLGTTYIASYHTDTGHYAADSGWFSASGTDLAPLHALQSGVDGANGVYHAGPSAFPTDSFGAANYWVDVVVNAATGPDVTPPSVTSTAPASNTSTVPLSTMVTGTFSEAVAPTSVLLSVSWAGGAVAGTTSYNAATKSATFTPSSPLAAGTSYSAALSAVDIAGNAMASPYSWSFTTGTPQAPPGQCPCSLWGDFSTPTTPSTTDASAAELGLKFRTSVGGYLTGVRFYKGAGNSGTHTGSVWASDGTRLATVTFTAESPSGWQQASFSNAVPVTADTTYVVSYHTDSGHYAANGGFFATSSFAYGPLTGLQTGTDGANGVYRYGSSALPTDSFGSANYWVDPVFSTVAPIDTTPPTVTSVMPKAGATKIALSPAVSATFSEAVGVNASLTVTDSQGNLVAGSTAYDSATRTATFLPAADLVAATTYNVAATATDLAGNVMATPYKWSFSTGVAATCPCSLYGAADAPTVASVADTTPAELGVRFRSDIGGYVNGLKFYKGTANTGTHTGTLWSSTGTLLASGTFAGESASGWQLLRFDAPVQIAAKTTYVVSYHTDAGRYAATSGAFSGAGIDNPPLHALAAGVDGLNGVFSQGPSAFPRQSFANTNYWVDVLFDTARVDLLPAHVVSMSPAAGSAGAGTGAVVLATFSETIDLTSLSFGLVGPGGAVPATVTYDAATSIASLSPTANLSVSTSYTATVSAKDTSGNAMAAPVVWSFTTGASQTCPCSLWSSTTVPPTPSVDDPSALELGVKIRSDVAGYVTGIRFYKGAGNTGRHTGSLWTGAGALLGAGTFAAETSTGWQTLTFDAPIAVAARTTYVASYHTDTGHYAASNGFFASAGLDNAPLHALASGVDGANGVYRLGASGFPSSSYQSTNYWVDAVYADNGVDTRPPTVVSTTPADGATSVDPTLALSTSFSEPVNSLTMAFTLKSAAGTTVPGVVAYDVTARKAVFTPQVALAPSTSYTASVLAADTAGNTMLTPTTWTFATSAAALPPGTCPCSLFGNATPANTASTDTGSVELGVRFAPAVAGTVTGVRFYKGGGNGGAHTGTLWSAAGTNLATGTFTGESASGWQTLVFANPVPVTAGATYVASYHAPRGQYAYDAGYFSAGRTVDPLSAPGGGNGVYGYGAATSFPISSYASTNYWVDVLFNRS